MALGELQPAEIPGISEGAALRRRTLVVAKFPHCLSDLTLAQSIATIVGRQRLVRCRIVRETNGSSKGYAFVEFVDELAANVVKSACDSGDLILVDRLGRPCVVKASRAKRATAAPTKTRAAVTTEDLMTMSTPSGELRLIL